MRTGHSIQRMQQRTMPPIIVDYLIDYGHAQHDYHGGIIHFFDKRSRRTLESVAGRRVVARLSDYLDC